MKLEFTDEPVSRGKGNPLYFEIASALRANPEKWAVWPLPTDGRQGHNMAANINLGRLKAFVGGFEATVKNGTLYVRFVGGAE